MTNVVRVFAVSGVTNIGKACALAAGESPKAVAGGDKAATPLRAMISPEVAAGMLLEKPNPVYPPIAKAAHVEGTVVLQATISKTGTITTLKVVSGPAMLQEAALDAVRTWRYRPYLLSNRPVEVETTVSIVFALGG
jgi:protein TonB